MAIRKFKIAGKMVRFVKGKGHVDTLKKMVRISWVSPGPMKDIAKEAARFKVSKGKLISIGLKNEMSKMLWKSNTFIAGAVTTSRKGKNVFVATRPGLRNTLNHELFHTKPIIGGSEIGAHFWGGLHSIKNKLSFKTGIKEVKRFAKTRPGEFKRELKIAGASVAGAAAITAGGNYVYRRIRGRVVRIKVKGQR